MDYNALSKAISICGSQPETKRCSRECPYYQGRDMAKCIPVMIADAAAAIPELLARAESAEVGQETLQNAMAYYKSRAEMAERKLVSLDMSCAAKFAVLREKLCAAEEMIADMLHSPDGKIETIFGYPVDEVRRLIAEDRAKKYTLQEQLKTFYSKDLIDAISSSDIMKKFDEFDNLRFVYKDEISEVSPNQWSWIMGRFMKGE